MELGFTGTQRGMTERQAIAVASLLDVLTPDGGHVHHGDCIGADAEFHALAVERGLRVEIHPPLNESKRAFCKGDILWPPYHYLTRNQHIVDHSEVLIAAPWEEQEQRRSGTWSTVRRARAKGIKVYLVFPSGHIR